MDIDIYMSIFMFNDDDGTCYRGKEPTENLLCFLESGGKNMMVNKQTTTNSINRSLGRYVWFALIRRLHSMFSAWHT
jgi:hypothetical protein